MAVARPPAHRCGDRGVIRSGGVARARAAAGFTLIEVLVAFAVLALGLTFLLGTLSGASRQLRQGGDAGTAALHAQSVLDAQGSTLVGPAQGAGTTADGYRWRFVARPWADPEAAGGSEAVEGARLLQVVVDVEWGDGAPPRQLHVSSLRLVTPPIGGAVP